MNFTDTDRLRFFSKVDEGQPGECWPWTGSRDKNGYGRFKLGGKGGRAHEAHRVAYALETGVMPQGHVLHSCDLRACCNPAHLSEGTHQENMKQAGERGRQRTPRPGNGRVKISTSQSAEIAAFCDNGANYSEVARWYKVSPATVRAHHRRHQP